MKKQQKDIDIQVLVQSNAIVAFTDGSCIGRGKTNTTMTTASGAGVYFPFNREHQDLSVKCEPPATNQRAELSAILFALLAVVDDPKHLIVITDSKYAQSVTNEWGWLWRETGTVKENMDLVDQILDAVELRRKKFADNVEVLRVYSHLASDTSLGLKTFDPNTILQHPFWVEKNTAQILTLCNAYADKLAKDAIVPIDQCDRAKKLKGSGDDCAKKLKGSGDDAEECKKHEADVRVTKVKLKMDFSEVWLSVIGQEEVHKVNGDFTANELHLEALSIACKRARETGISSIASYSKYALGALTQKLTPKTKHLNRILELREVLEGINAKYIPSQ